MVDKVMSGLSKIKICPLSNLDIEECESRLSFSKNTAMSIKDDLTCPNEFSISTIVQSKSIQFTSSSKENIVFEKIDEIDEEQYEEIVQDNKNKVFDKFDRNDEECEGTDEHQGKENVIFEEIEEVEEVEEVEEDYEVNEQQRKDIKVFEEIEVVEEEYEEDEGVQDILERNELKLKTKIHIEPKKRRNKKDLNLSRKQGIDELKQRNNPVSFTKMTTSTKIPLERTNERENTQKNKKLNKKKIMNDDHVIDENQSYRDAPKIAMPEKSIFELSNSAIDTQKHVESKVVTKPNIYSMLRLVFEKNISPSVRIQIKNVFIDCHMMVLQCYSDFFTKCGNAHLIVLPAKCVSASAFRMFYEWCLSGNPMLSVSTIVDLMKTAMYLRVSVLVDICFQHLYDDLFNEDVAFYVYIKAHNAGLPFVAHLMLTRIGRFFLPMVACKEFLNLSPREMLELLDADLIGLNTEAEVLFALVRWANDSWLIRKRFVPKLAIKVRFGLMPPWYLYALLRGTGSEEVDRVLDSKGVKAFINDSIMFAMRREEQNILRDQLFRNMPLPKVPQFRERLWIIDQHMKKEHQSTTNWTYESFQLYLNHLRSRDLSEFQKWSIGNSPKPRVDKINYSERTKPLVMFKKLKDNGKNEEANVTFPNIKQSDVMKVKKRTKTNVPEVNELKVNKALDNPVEKKSSEFQLAEKLKKDVKIEQKLKEFEPKNHRKTVFQQIIEKGDSPFVQKVKREEAILTKEIKQNWTSDVKGKKKKKF